MAGSCLILFMVEELHNPIKKKDTMTHTEIKLNAYEIQCGTDRQQYAELLILQLPSTHQGASDWLLFYGVSPRAIKLREEGNFKWDNETRSGITFK